MRYVLLFALSIIAGSFTSAQSDSTKAIAKDSIANKEIHEYESCCEEWYSPEQYDFGITFNLTGLINTIVLKPITDINNNDAFLIRFYLRDDIALRGGIGLTSWNNSLSTVVDSLGYRIARDSTYTKVNFYFSPGIEKHFFPAKRLDPYLGLNLEIGRIGRTTISDRVTKTDSVGKEINTKNTLITGGYSLGSNLIAGFNYFFTKNLSIGAEYRWGYNSQFTGGDKTIDTNNRPVNGAPTVKHEVSSEITTRGGFGMSSSGAITLSWFF